MNIIKPIKGFEGLYSITSTGRVISYKGSKPRDIVGDYNNCGYRRVIFCKNKNNRKRIFVHRLVAEAFIPKKPGKEFINHINEDKKDNRIENLEWCTCAENARHGTRNERVSNTNIRNLVQKNLNGEILNIYARMSEKPKGYNHNKIRSCSNGEIDSYKGFIWSII